MIRTINSIQHDIVKHVVKVRQNRDYRIDHQSVIIEGIKPVLEVAKHLKPKRLIASTEMLLKHIQTDELIIVSNAVMKKMSGMLTPEGLLAEIPMPKPAPLTALNYLVVLDGVNDPGNVGTLLRTALAFGWEGAFILNDSCDPFNEKALRAARGATFRLPLSWGDWAALKKIIHKNQLTPIGAEIKGCPLQQFEKKDKVCLILGNEACGLSNQAKLLSQPVTIEMAGDMESLNVAVAGGILMFALKKV